MTRVRTLLALSLALAFGVVPARAERCPELFVGTAARGGAETLLPLGQELVLDVGWNGELFLVHAGGPDASRRPAARIGDLDRSRGAPLELDPQTAADIAAGRAGARARSPGQAVVAFSLVDAAADGVLGGVPAECRSGALAVRVVAVRSGAGEDAARDLVALVRRALLGEGATTPTPAEVMEVTARGRDGLVEVAGRLAASRSFRVHATQLAGGVAALGDPEDAATGTALRRALFAIYRELYGATRVPLAEHRCAESDLLAVLAEGDTASAEGFGRRLVGAAAFAARQEERLRGLPGASAPPPVLPTPDLAVRYGAAEDLAALLQRAILRRTLAGPTRAADVDAMVADGLVGVAEVAAALAASRELRTSALRRALAARPAIGPSWHGSREEARALLLDAVHADLYGPAATVPPATRAERERLLADCLATPKAAPPETCRRLGRDLVLDPRFREAQALAVARLVEP